MHEVETFAAIQGVVTVTTIYTVGAVVSPIVSAEPVIVLVALDSVVASSSIDNVSALTAKQVIVVVVT